MYRFKVIVISTCLKGTIVNLDYYFKIDLNVFISVLSVKL